MGESRKGGPKGLRLEVGARRAPELLVFPMFNNPNPISFVDWIWSQGNYHMNMPKLRSKSKYESKYKLVVLPRAALHQQQQCQGSKLSSHFLAPTKVFAPENCCEVFLQRTEKQKAADILSKAVLIFGPSTERNRNREHCAVRSVLFTLWSKHKSDRRVPLTIVIQ